MPMTGSGDEGQGGAAGDDSMMQGGQGGSERRNDAGRHERWR